MGDRSPILIEYKIKEGASSTLLFVQLPGIICDPLKSFDWFDYKLKVVVFIGKLMFFSRPRPPGIYTA